MHACKFWKFVQNLETSIYNGGVWDSWCASQLFRRVLLSLMKHMYRAICLQQKSPSACMPSLDLKIIYTYFIDH